MLVPEKTINAVIDKLSDLNDIAEKYLDGEMYSIIHNIRLELKPYSLREQKKELEFKELEAMYDKAFNTYSKE